MTIAEKLALNRLARSGKTGNFLEIGSFVGASSCFIAAGLGPAGKLYCIDTWNNDAMSEGFRDTHAEFLKNTAKYRDRIVQVRGYSHDVLDEVVAIAPQLDFLFIDGDHSYEGCKKDWDLYSPLVKSGGVVVFHDSGWAEGVKRVIAEDALPKMTRHGELPNMFWGWIR